MLTIRLFSKGRKNQPFFKVVVTPKENPPKGGRFVEEIGFVNPLTKERKVNKERAKHWLSVGAQPSDTVYNLFIKENIIEGKKIPLHKKKKESEEEKKEAEKKEASAKEGAPAEEKKEEPSEEEGKQEEAKDSPQEEPKSEEAPQKEEPKQESAEAPQEEDKKEQPREQEKKE